VTANGWFQIFFYLLVILLVTKPLGIFMARVFSREKTFLDAILRPIEKLIYRLTGVDENQEMKWTEYTVAMLLFSGVSMAEMGFLRLLRRASKRSPIPAARLCWWRKTGACSELSR
jgi:potassium-transporting ATPase potassium-binding subunit